MFIKNATSMKTSFFLKCSIGKNHIDNGGVLLGGIFQECGCDLDSLLMRLVDEVEFGGRRETAGHGLDIFIGRTLLQRTELTMELNNTSKHANSHLAIMGKPGTGKNTVHFKNGGGYSSAVQFPDKFHLF